MQMKIILFSLFLLFPQGGFAGEIRDHCKKEFGEDRHDYRDCVDRQRRARSTLRLSKNKEPKIFRYCKDLFKSNWYLADVCFDQEVKKKELLEDKKFWLDEQVYRYCRKNFGESWSLSETCIKVELESKEKYPDFDNNDSKIAETCKDNFLSSGWNLVLTCVTENLKSKKRAKKLKSTKPKIYETCINTVGPPDWILIEKCIRGF